MLHANALTVEVDQKMLLDDISLHINPGEFVAVIGPNGAGKSTLLKSLCGEIIPTSGIIEINGKRMSEWAVAERAKICAVLPQNSKLSFPFSVLEVVLMGRSPHANTRNATHDDDIARQAMSLAGIDQLSERTYTTLSGGERQRVHFARALTQIWEPINSQTRYLMLDEPTSALDISCQHDCLKSARDFSKQQNTGVLVVLHDLNLAALYADRIVVLLCGKIFAFDTPREIINVDLIQHVFNYSAQIYAHPQCTDRPLVIPMGPYENSNNQKGRSLMPLPERV